MEISIYKTSNALRYQPTQQTLSRPIFTSKKEEFTESPELKKYKKASKYAQKLINKKGYVNLESANLKKLEGIQYGIDVFEGLNMEQIRLLYKHLGVMTMYRGCSNGCVHCFVDAKNPQTHVNSDLMQAMSWEDLNSITGGFEKLNQRLGYGKNITTEIVYKIIAPFMDADSMEIFLTDKNGKEHDAVDIAENIKKMGKTTLFDTSGWNPKSEKMQKRAEKYVEYMMQEDNNFEQINISLNPFHKLNAKYIEQLKLNPNMAKKYRDLYVTRMANVFYTFTPLFDKSNFRILNRAAKNGSLCDIQYQETAHRELINDIKSKLIKQYLENNVPLEKVLYNIKLFEELTRTISSNKIIPQGRMQNLFAPESEEITSFIKIHNGNIKNPNKMLNRTRPGFWLDCNGQLYLFDGYDVIKTDMSLNLRTKNRKTPQLATITNTEITSKELIKKLRSKNVSVKKIFAKLVNFLRK